MWYPIRVKDNNTLNLEFAIKNLTDEFYYKGAMITGRSRQFFGGMSWKF